MSLDIKRNNIVFRKLLFIACMAVVILGSIQAGFAATSLPAYTGTLTGEASPPDEPLSLWYCQAESMIDQTMMASPRAQPPYQPIGDILLTFPKFETTENYIRDLNLRTATASVRFTSNGTTYTRELFASYPDNVIVMRLTANKPGQISFKLSIVN